MLTVFKLNNFAIGFSIRWLLELKTTSNVKLYTPLVRREDEFDVSKVQVAEKSQIFTRNDVAANLDTATHSSTVKTRSLSR